MRNFATKSDGFSPFSFLESSVRLVYLRPVIASAAKRIRTLLGGNARLLQQKYETKQKDFVCSMFTPEKNEVESSKTMQVRFRIEKNSVHIHLEQFDHAANNEDEGSLEKKATRKSH